MLLTAFALLLGACQPTPNRAATTSTESAAPQAVPAVGGAAGPRTIIIGGGRQHTDMGAFGVSDYEVRNLVDAELMRKNALTITGEPWMAEERPSVEKGTWQVNADGSMVTTYKLRPGIKWHDGVPFTPKDVIFGWELIRDTRIPFGDRSVAQNINKIEAPDDRTIVLYWTKIYNRADELYSTKLRPYPAHILEDVYRNQPLDSFSSNPWWTSGFIGTGPFKVMSWDQDVEINLQAVDDYFLGRPKVDRIIWRFIFDTNTMLSNVLSNNVDAALRQAFTLDTGLVAKDQWAAKGEGTVIFSPVNMDRIGLSPYNPWLRDLRVRQALLHAIDRPSIVATLSRGVEEVAHIPLSPGRPQYEQALAVATKYDYDPQRASRLLADAGWTPGADGILVNGSGERFVVDGRTDPQVFQVQLQSAISDNWKRVGVAVDVHNLTQREESSSEQTRGHYAGVKWDWNSFAIDQWRFFYATASIPTAQNAWIGSNEIAWDDPGKEAALDQMDRSLEQAPYNAAVVQFTKLFSEQLPALPIKLQAEVMSVRKGLTNLYTRKELGGENTRTWNAEQWEWK
jgi:peptide/nickel transport system substrate-binding protein